MGPDERPSVPEHELHIDFVRSSGPGGQKVNKTSSKAQLHWNVGASQAFTDEQKATIRTYAANRLNKEDEIVLDAQAERSQLQNRQDVTEHLQTLVVKALTPKKKRKPTKISKAKKRQRLDEKRRGSEKKQRRKPERGEW